MRSENAKLLKLMLKLTSLKYWVNASKIQSKMSQKLLSLSLAKSQFNYSLLRRNVKLKLKKKLTLLSKRNSSNKRRRLSCQL